MQKYSLYDLLVYKLLEEWSQLLITLVRFLFTALFVVIWQQSNSSSKRCHLSIHHFFLNFKQIEIKLVLFWIILRVISMGLALLYRYYPLTLENKYFSSFYHFRLLVLFYFCLFLLLKGRGGVGRGVGGRFLSSISFNCFWILFQTQQLLQLLNTSHIYLSYKSFMRLPCVEFEFDK